MAKRKTEKKKSLEGLMKEGFARTDKQIEDLALSTARGLSEMSERNEKNFKITFEGMRIMQDDIKDTKRTLHSFVNLIATHDNEIDEIKDRLNRVERKVGISK